MHFAMPMEKISVIIYIFSFSMPAAHFTALATRSCSTYNNVICTYLKVYHACKVCKYTV